MPPLQRRQRNNVRREDEQENKEEVIVRHDPTVPKETSVQEPEVPIVENFVNHHPSLPTGPRPEDTPIPARVTTPYPLRSKPKENYDDVRAMFEKIKIEIPLLEAIQHMPRYSKFLKEVCTQKRFTNLPRNAYVTQVVDSLHMVDGVVKYKDPGTPTVEGTIVCAEPFTGRALVDL